MKALKIFAAVLGALVIGLVGFFGYLGGFSSVEITEGSVGPHEVIYSLHRGGYGGLSKSWHEFEERFKAAGLAECDSMAFYLDPPETPEDKLRSVLACRIDALDPALKSALKAKFPAYFFPKLVALQASFPFRMFFSYMLGPMKVYPKMADALEERDVDPNLAIEVYGTKDPVMRYYFPIGNEPTIFQPLADAFR